MDSYKDKKVLIIGGSEGIGFSLAKEFLGEGAKVAIASRSQEKLDKARSNLSVDVYTASLDITDYQASKQSLDLLVGEFGVPDVLINCAGIAHPRYLEESQSEEIDQMLSLNARGPIYSCRLLIPQMIANGGGQILNVSSVAGYVGLFGYTSYCASKAAVIAFSEALREEMIYSNIQVSVLCPPNTKTPGLEIENKHKPAEVLATEEKVKTLEPSEVARYTLKKMKKNAFWIIPTMDSQLAFYLKRYAPAVLRMFTKRPKPATKSLKSERV